MHDPSNYLLEQVEFRQVEQKDLPALEWDGELIHFRGLFSEVFQRSMRGDGLMWVADYRNEKIIGQLFISFSANSFLMNSSKRAYIHGFRIRSEYRGQGIGSAMVQWVEADLKRRHCQIVTLNVAQDNPNAIRLYKRLGYVIVGFEPGEWSYIDHNGIRQQVKEPAWKMEKRLPGL